MSVAMHFYKAGEDFVDVVKRVRPLRVSSYFCDLPRRQITVDVFGELLAFFRQLLNFF
jgi:hypothetical protein